MCSHLLLWILFYLLLHIAEMKLFMATAERCNKRNKKQKEVFVSS